MKTTKIFFWIVTIIFSAFMLFSGISEIMVVPDAVKVMEHLGYPNYLTVFLGYAKILGVIAILIPADFPRIKEWAYAGFFFDLAGATYSGIAVDGFAPPMLFMVLFFAFLFASYFLYHKIRKGKTAQVGR